VEEKLKDYEILIRSKTVDKQLLVEVAWGQEDMKINYNSWTSNVKFENRFFTNKEQILDKIKFFIENPEWYNERGIPWTLGFLLWGKPGCGKTGFIKALMNLTKRSAISIKLNNKFNINKLKRIIYDDEINEDLIISQNNRIIIFEDIDCMGDIVVDRDIKNNDKTILEEALKLKYKDKDDLQKISLLETNNDNNLSNILNILDGIQECPGRIIIMTTNKPDILDPALIRSGRIDYKIEFTFATLKDVENIVKFYWDYHEEIKLNSVINLKYSHADIVNFCRLSNDIFETINHLD
jgi:chaperone BCS1